MELANKKHFEISDEFRNYWRNLTPSLLDSINGGDSLELKLTNEEYIEIRRELLKFMQISEHREILSNFDLFEIDLFRDVLYSLFLNENLDFECLRVSLVEASAILVFIGFLGSLSAAAAFVSVRFQLVGFIRSLSV